MELFEALDGTHAVLHSAIIAAVTDGWTNASPCDGWTVRDVAQHVVGGAVRYRLLLEGLGEEALAPTRTQDQLGDDPAGSDATKSAALMAVARAADLTAPVQHPSGVRTGRELLNLRVVECVVHAWDIAAGSGQALDLDPELGAFALACVDDAGNVEGFYAPPLERAAGTALDGLLARTGRSSAS